MTVGEGGWNGCSVALQANGGGIGGGMGWGVGREGREYARECHAVARIGSVVELTGAHLTERLMGRADRNCGLIL